MMRRVIAAFVAASIPIAALAQQCLLPGAVQMPPDSLWAAGPNVFAAHTANPAVGTAIYDARDAWDITNAVNRIGNWNNVVSPSDCPLGLPMQIGAFNFATTPCATVTAYGLNAAATLAFVDYFPGVCVGCGTRSLSVNLAFAWALGTPLAGQYDLQSVLAHEFGHMLGLGHMYNGVCVATSPSCAANPGRETMGGTFFPGPVETCERDVTATDTNSANGLY